MDRGTRFKNAIGSKAAAKGWHTDEALAKHAGVSVNTLGNWWKGKGLELGSLAAVADALDETVFSLLADWQGRPVHVPPEPVAAAIDRQTAVLRDILGVLSGRPIEAVFLGNSSLWAAAFVALGLRYGWPWTLLVIKPTFLPLALVGGRRRETWVGFGIAALVALPLGTLWLDWLAVLRNFDGPPGYTFFQLPLVVSPLVAWATKEARPPKGAG